MSAYIYPALFSLFVWWFSTGAIIFLDNLPRKTFKWSLLGASVVFLVCLWGVHKTSSETTTASAYWAFGFGLFAWGWQEISYYMGIVTGTRKQPCPEGCGGFKHFIHAIQTSIWHELAIIASAVAVVALTWHQPNQVGMWTFMVLWWMHQSAKLNVFFGVRNLNEEFLPEHLNFLKSFLKSKPMNLFFPFSITISMVICTMLFEHAAHATTAFGRAGAMFLATLMALAILEHWFLVIPLPAGKLWKWGLASRKPSHAFEAEIVTGFLGAGKTTFMRRRLDELASLPGKTVVLVNDFASVGIDGSLLSAQGADVVELPNGCICCSLRDDLSRQLQDTVTRFSPDRVLIEPSGVADIASLIGVLRRPELSPFVKNLGITTIIDAGAFLADYATLPAHFAAQAKLASVIIINKTDLVSAAERAVVAESLRRLNPNVKMLTARYGMVEATPILITAQPEPHAHAHHNHYHHEHAEHKHAEHEHEHDHAAEGLGFTSWTTELSAPCDADALLAVLHAAAAQKFGHIARLKGLVQAGAGWLHIDIAGGRASMNAYSPTAGEQARIVAIGRDIKAEELQAALTACTYRRTA
jgi:putative photosynthetic complex assembly protein 2